MNTHDIDIELPPLPTPPSLIQRKDWYGAIQAYARSYGKECARAAIEADRQRRGEPVAYGIIAANTGRICQLELAEDYEGAGLDQMRPEHVVPLYESPQPAEPVRVPRPHEFNTGNEKLDTLLDDTYYLVKDGGMDNAIKWHESLQEFLTILEPVKVPSDADAKHVQDFIDCDGMGSMIVEGPQYSAVVRALLDRYSSIHDAQRWRKARALPRSWWRDAFNRISTPEELDALIDAHGEKRLP